MRRTPFSVGRRWRCTPRVDSDKRPFDFVILGPGATPREKRCRIEVVGHDPTRVCWGERNRCAHACAHGLETTYSHNHLKKRAVLLDDDQHGERD